VSFLEAVFFVCCPHGESRRRRLLGLAVSLFFSCLFKASFSVTLCGQHNISTGFFPCLASTNTSSWYSHLRALWVCVFVQPFFDRLYRANSACDDRMNLSSSDGWSGSPIFVEATFEKFTQNPNPYSYLVNNPQSHLYIYTCVSASSISRQYLGIVESCHCSSVHRGHRAWSHWWHTSDSNL
jgi:hypothetical protein